MKTLSKIILAAICTASFTLSSSVSAAPPLAFPKLGTYERNCAELKILKVTKKDAPSFTFSLTASNCKMNTGEIEKGTVFEACSDEGCAWYGQDDKNNECTLAFDIKGNIIEISHLNDVTACKFGANVSATGKYRKK